MNGIFSRERKRILTGTIWPSRDFSYGSYALPPDESVDLNTFREWERNGALDLADGQSCGRYGVPEGASAPLDLSNLPNSHRRCGPQVFAAIQAMGKPKPDRPESYGRKGITGYGKKMIKSVGALIDRELPRHRVTFATITMPELPPQLRRELALAWPELVRQLLQWLARRLKQKGLPTVVASVSEIQPKRLSESGQGYLHLHLLWLNAPGRAGNWAIDVLNLRAWIAEFLQKRGLWTTDSHVNVDVRSVKGDKAAYLAKYVSKGGDCIAEFADDNGWEAVPSQWWNLTKAARDWVKARVVKGQTVGEFIEHLLWNAWDTNDFSDLWFIYQVEIEYQGKLLNVGWRGAFVESAYLEVLEALLKSS